VQVCAENPSSTQMRWGDYNLCGKNRFASSGVV
jgi:hypothetical protein